MHLTFNIGLFFKKNVFTSKGERLVTKFEKKLIRVALCEFESVLQICGNGILMVICNFLQTNAFGIYVCGN
jgi:hypothetical protein